MASNSPNCSCLYGTAVVDANGVCRCLNDSIDPSITALDKNATVPPPVVNNYYWPFQQSSNGNSPTIFGMSPILVLGAGLAALWIFSNGNSNSNKK